MYLTTEAVVLQLYPHKDQSAVVKLYTQQAGLISCWAASVHKKTSKTKVNLLQPLSIITAELNQKENNSLIQLKEIETAAHTPHISLNIEKSSIAIFIAELLSKSLKESSADESLYAFICHSILLLDTTSEKCTNFHLLFIIRLAEHFGLLPKGNFSEHTPYFNLQDSAYQPKAPLHPHFLNPAESNWLSRLTTIRMENFYEPSIPAPERKLLLHGLLEYLEIHLAMSRLKSHLVLEAIF